MSKQLTPEQKRRIEEWVKMDFECGLPEDDWDEVRQMCKEDPDLCNAPKKATEYYFDLIEYGPAGFYEMFKDEFDDWDKGFVSEYGDDEDESNEDDEDDENEEDYDDIEEEM